MTLTEKKIYLACTHKSASDIARQFGITREKVFEVLDLGNKESEKLCVPKKRCFEGRRAWTDEELEQVICLYSSGMIPPRIAQILGRKASSVYTKIEGLKDEGRL